MRAALPRRIRVAESPAATPVPSPAAVAPAAVVAGRVCRAGVRPAAAAAPSCAPGAPLRPSPRQRQACAAGGDRRGRAARRRAASRTVAHARRRGAHRAERRGAARSARRRTPLPAADEAPIDRLRRRLGQVLTARALDAVASGDLRLRTRSAATAMRDGRRRRPQPRQRAGRRATPAGDAARTGATTARRRPAGLGPAEARVRQLRQRHSARARSTSATASRVRPGAGAVRLQAERLRRHRQRPHGAGQRRAGQRHRGAGPALRAAAVPLPPPVGRAHRRPPVRHGRAPGAQGRARAAWRWSRCCSNAAARSRCVQTRVEQPAAREGRRSRRRACRST